MKLKALIEEYSGFFKECELNKLNNMGLNDFEVPEKVGQFIIALANKTLPDQDDFINFDAYCMREIAASEFLVEIVYAIFGKIYEQDYKSEIEAAIATIERVLKASEPIPLQPEANDRYHALMNCYLFFTLVAHNNNWHKTFQNKLIFGLNALRLTGRLAREGMLAGVDLSRPFYPMHLTPMMQNPVVLSSGFKDADLYFPFKYASKLFTGDTGDNTLLVTNGAKLLFVRGVRDYAPGGVFASKIAKLISEKHFSSERVLTNRLVGTNSLPGYAVSVADSTTRLTRKDLIEQRHHVFSGTGIIDEVCNFVRETDFNIENFGFSTADIAGEDCYLSKIDFDRCSIGFSQEKKNYELNALTGRRGIYHALSHVPLDTRYIYEKLYTRIKLCLIPDDLLAQLADRSYFPEDVKQKERDLEAVCNRKKIVLELFFEHPEVRSFLEENPAILKQCFQELENYIHKHYRDKEQKSRLQSALKTALVEMQETVLQQMQIRLEVDLNQNQLSVGLEALYDFEVEKVATHQMLDSNLRVDDQPVFKDGDLVGSLPCNETKMLTQAIDIQLELREKKALSPKEPDPFEETLNALPEESLLRDEINRLRQELIALGKKNREIYEKIGKNTKALMEFLHQPEQSFEHKLNAIHHFQNASTVILPKDSTLEVVEKILLVLVITAVVTLLAASLCFGIGACIPAFAGLAGAAASAATVGIAAGSMATGYIAGTVTAFSVFKPSPVEEQMDTVAKAAQHDPVIQAF